MNEVTQRDSNRRDFLLGRSAVQALQNLVPPTGEDVPTPAAADTKETYLVQIGRTAMACEFDIFLNAKQHSGGEEAAVEALDLVDRLETQMTVYRTTSEIIEINQRAASEPVTVEPRLYELIKRAVQLHTETRGAFDITSGPLSKAWGFFRRSGRFPTTEEVEAAKKRMGSQWIELEDESRSIRFLREGLEINLNAIGKGYALDRCAELLAARGVENFLIHGGQSSILARGSRSLSVSHDRGWLVSVKHPSKTELRLAEVWLKNRALGTSGSGNQFFHFQGQRFGHVIDPRTGWPAEQVLSVTVLAPDAAAADSLSTAFFVMGVEETQRFCQHRPELAVLFIASGERAGEIALHAIGFREDELRVRGAE